VAYFKAFLCNTRKNTAPACSENAVGTLVFINQFHTSFLLIHPTVISVKGTVTESKIIHSVSMFKSSCTFTMITQFLHSRSK
jgi:hypothetical protein